MEDKLKKRMRIMLISVAVLFGSIFIYKTITGFIFKRFMARQSQIVTVSTTKADYSSWRSELMAVGSLRAVRGVDVTTELAGMVKTIYFTPGAVVKQGNVLVQLNADADVAQLNALQASAELAKTTYRRDKAQYAAQAISKATLDVDAANAHSTEAQVAQQIAMVAKKTITAPFSGRLGISAINPGQYVNPGNKVVTLQQLDPIYVDFYLPQQEIEKLSVGQVVKMTVDAFPGKTFTGKITTIDPIVDVSTRNVEIEATITNPNLQLVPGMFASVNINLDKVRRYLTLPQAAISFNSYGDVVFLVGESGKDSEGKPILTATQNFVTTGETRGDQVAVLTGLKAGDVVVTGGQLKLKNGSVVAVNNSVVPANNPVPKVGDES